MNNNIGKKEAINTLISLIENSNDTELRKKSIELIQKLQFKEQRIFELLESCLVSDKNPIIRANAAKVIISNFSFKGLNLLKWSVKNDNSPLVCGTIYQSSNNNHLMFLRERILDKFSHIFGIAKTETGFFLDLYGMFVESWKDEKLKIKRKILYRSKDLSDFKYAWEDNLYIVKKRHVIALKYSDKRLRKIPESIKFLKKLRCLDLSRCKISKLPDSFKSLSKLRYLDLSRNMITFFPSPISELNSLRTLNLEINYLKRLPKELFELRRLEKLLLSFNELNEIPNLFEKLTHIQEISIGEKKNTLIFNPRYSLAWYKLAEGYLKIGLNKLANDCCEIALSINPNFKLVKDLHVKIVKSINGNNV